MLFFTFIKGGGVTPLTGPPNLNGFSSIIRGGGVKSLLTNVNKKMFFLMKASITEASIVAKNIYLSTVCCSCLQKSEQMIQREIVYNVDQFSSADNFRCRGSNGCRTSHRQGQK